MAKNKTPKAKMTENQKAWRKQITRLKGIITRGINKGLQFAEDILPVMPKRVTKKTIERVSKIRAKDIYEKATFFDDSSGETFSGTAAIEHAFPSASGTSKAYRRERDRVRKLIKRAEKRGDVIPSDLIPEHGKRVTQADIEALKAITPDVFYSRIITPTESGNITGTEARARRRKRRREKAEPVENVSPESYATGNETPEVQKAIPVSEEKPHIKLEKPINNMAVDELRELVSTIESLGESRNNADQQIKNEADIRIVLAEIKERNASEDAKEQETVKGKVNKEKPYTVERQKEYIPEGASKAESDRWLEEETALEGNPELPKLSFNEIGYHATYGSDNVFEFIKGPDKIRVNHNGEPFAIIDKNGQWSEWSEMLEMYIPKEVINIDSIDDIVVSGNALIDSKTGELITQYNPYERPRYGPVTLATGDIFDGERIIDNSGSVVDIDAQIRDYENSEEVSESFDYHADSEELESAEKDYEQNPSDKNFKTLDEIRQRFAESTGVNIGNGVAEINIIEDVRAEIENIFNAVTERHGSAFHKFVKGGNHEMFDLQVSKNALLNIFEDTLLQMGEDAFTELLEDNSDEIYSTLQDINRYKSYEQLSGSIGKLAQTLNHGPLTVTQWADFDASNFYTV